MSLRKQFSFRNHFRKKIYLACLSVAGVFLAFWPTLTNGLDSHHDGLVITTINMTKTALFYGGDLPFNQYGPAWSFFYAFVSLPFPSSYTLIVARIITLVFYMLTIMVLRQTTRILNIPNLWPTVLIALFLTQPWTTGYGTTFLAWPSAMSMFLLTMTVYLVLKIHEGIKVTSNLNLLGILSGLLIFTRFQIGVATLILSIAFVATLRNFKYLSRFFVNFLLTSLAFSSLLYVNGWLGYYIFDDVIYAITYVEDKYSVNPFPKFTIVTSIFVLVSLLLVEKLPKKYNFNRYKYSGLFNLLPIAAATLLITTLILAWQEFENLLILTIRRAWIGGTIGLTLFYTLRILFNSESRKSSTNPYRIQNWLFLYGGIGMIQLYPLFDQVHFWWGLSPLVIPLAMLILSFLNHFRVDVRKFLVLTLILIGTTTILVPSIKAGFSRTEPYTGNIAKLIRISPDSNSDLDELQSFFRKSTNLKQPRVLNLCHNPDVFLAPNFAKSASRYFIYWPPFTDISRIDQELLSSHPDLVVTCSQTQVPKAANDVKVHQNQLLKSLGFDYSLSKYKMTNGTSWQIFTKN